MLTMLSWNKSLNLHLIGETLDPISTASWNKSRPNNFSWKTAPTADFRSAKSLNLNVLFVPGGIGTRSPNLTATVEFVKEMYPNLKYLISVCTGAGVLARAGLLDGRNATTNKKAWKDVTAYGKRTYWVAKARWVEDGNVWTTGGVAAGIDGTLGWIQKIWGKDLAEELALNGEIERNTGIDRFAEAYGIEDVKPEL